MLDNPYLAEVRKYYNYEEGNMPGITREDDTITLDPLPCMDYWSNYWRLKESYAFGIPDEKAIKLIASYSPIVEMCAGLGYWAYLLDQMGCDIVAYDTCPDGGNKYIPNGKTPWFNVQKCDEDFVPPRNRSLFMCWPPYDDSVAFDILSRYSGDTLVYVGEYEGGACADGQFFELIDDSWDQIEWYDIPQFYGLHDELTIYKRKGASRNEQ